jgi:fibronectin type 3 domain-containing protein
VVEIILAPSQVQNLAVSASGQIASLTWDTVSAATEYNVYRSTVPGPVANGSVIDTVTTNSYDDTTLSEGTQYFYAVTAVNEGGESEASAGASVTIALPAPAIDTATLDGNGNVDVAWTLNSTDEDGVRVYARVTSDSVWGSVDADLSAGTVSTTLTDAPDGAVIDVRVEVYTTDVSSDDVLAEAVTTPLPDVQELTLSNGIEDEIEVSWDPESINNGDFRIEYEDDESPGFAPHDVVDNAISSSVIFGVLDGQQYNVRVRTETAYTTGNWVEQSITTVFPSVSDVTVISSGSYQVDVTWTDNADNERGQRLLREQLVDGSWWPYEVIADLNPDITSYTDDTLQPNRTYRYTVGSFTDYASTESDPSDDYHSETVDVASDRAPAQGWRVEIDDTVKGATRTPAITDPQLQPTINGHPRARFGTPRDDTWQQERFDDAPIRIWRDGIQQPLDVVEHRDVSTDSTTFEARGGTELDRRVVARSDSVEPVAEFVERLIADESGYTPMVDNIERQLREGVILQAADVLAELQAAFVNIPTDIPLKWDGDDLVPLQTAFVQEAEDASGAATDIIRSDFSGGGGVAHSTDTNRTEITINLGYETNNLKLYLRAEDTSGQDEFIALNLEDESGSFVAGGQSPGSPLNWYESSISGTYGPGKVTFTLTPDVDINSGSAEIDLVAIVDDRWSYTFPSSLNGDYFDGPQPFPDNVRLELQQINTPLSIAEVTLSATTVNGAPLPELGVREDGTGSYVTEADTTSTTLTYNTLEAAVQGRIGLGRRTGLTPRNQTPRLGYEPQRLDSVDLRADLDETPVLINRTFDDKLINILQECMEVYDGAFEIREGDPTEVHVSRIDGRPVDIDPQLVDVSVDRSTEGAVDRAIVYAAAESIRRLPVETTVDEWVTLPLGDGRIVEGSETVYDALTDDEEPLTRGNDYEIRKVVVDGPPEIKLLTSISEPRVDCDYKPRGEHERANLPENPKEIVEDAPELTSKQMADLAAFQAVEGSYSQAVIDATVTLPPDEIGFEVLDALNVAGLPGDEPYQVQDIDVDAKRIRVRLGAGQTAGEAVQEIRDKTGRVSERV